MERLRALWILTTNFGKNGTTAVVTNYYGALDPALCQIDLVSPNEPSSEMCARLAENGGRAFVLPMRNKNPFAYIRALSKIVRAGRYDVVHAHGNSATLLTEMFAAKIGGAPVRIAHSHNTACTHNRIHKLLWRAFDSTLTCRMACGQQAGQWLFRDRPFTVLNNAVDTARFAFSEKTREEVRKAAGFAENAFVLGHAGLFTKRKNHAFLADVFAEVAAQDPKARLLLIGGGETLGETRSRLAAHGLLEKTVFAGETDQVPALLCAMDVFVLPSFSEGLPVTLVEAQSSGLFCVCSDAVTRESDMTGRMRFLPLAAGAGAWAEEIRALPASDRARSSIAAAARIQAAGYDIRANGQHLLALYRAEAEKAGKA